MPAESVRRRGHFRFSATFLLAAERSCEFERSKLLPYAALRTAASADLGWETPALDWGVHVTPPKEAPRDPPRSSYAQ